MLDVYHAFSAVHVLWLLERGRYLPRCVLVSVAGLLFTVTRVVRVPLLALVGCGRSCSGVWTLFVAGRFRFTFRFVIFLTCFGVHQGEVLYGVQRYPVDGLIPRVRANRGHRCGPRGCMTHSRRRLRVAIKWLVFDCVREAGGMTWCHYVMCIDPATQLGRPS